ncbi:transmembrane protein 213 isoform X2 [Rousettus aegyptiacus]|uniref:transmembrane protein 213 isoform X2 n=1 Tax=Rousettus aegyptiacus TaxID=9407 RepID=UPI00168D4568|nr:transmembrane protein 213 isoform X2 [Rousettus aegyptiacus]
MVQVDASLPSMKRLASVPRAALVLSLVLGSLHSACLAASSGSNSTLTAHHPDPETLEQCLSKLLPTALTRAGPGAGRETQASWLSVNQRHPDVDFCPQAARCCRIGVDEYGWIMAAIGWSLWFLTLILLCVDKLLKLTPDEPKDLQA